MQYLKENGYRVLSLNEFEECFSHKSCPDKSVLITIDDGYKSVMKAFGIFKKYRYPFVLFLYMEAVGSYPDFLSIKDIRTLKSSGLVEFGNHSYSHFSLVRLRKMPSTKLKGLLEKDLELSERKFKALFGNEPRAFAYPYGEYSREVVDLLEKKGYVLAFTQDLGAVGNCTYRYLIPRIPLVGSWSSLERFKEFLEIYPLCDTETLPYGFVNNPVTVTLAQGALDNCFLYATDSGWVKAKSKSFCLKEGRKRIGIKCIKDGKIRLLMRVVIPRGGECQLQ
ncbi:polysaccharide deacetylase family protein [Thermosulfidibacter takaii]|nr:polysaccharide deacetylase family protein [Thermosulfidibacter takaii]